MDAIRMLAALSAALLFNSSLWAQFQSNPFDMDQPVAELARADQRAPQGPIRIVNKELDFVIPFEMARTSNDVSEVHLHVSADEGKQWQLYKRQAPDAGGFPFRAAGEGEYWFAVRTIGRNAATNAPLNLKPELVVVVDRQRPRLNLRVEQTNGNATAEWVTTDDTLDVSTFRLQQQDENGEWQEIAYTKLGPQDKRTQWKGQTQWQLRNRGTEVAIRAEISDQAGNVQVANKRLPLSGDSNAFDRNSQDKVAANRRTSPVGQTWESFQEGAKQRWSSLIGGVTTSNPPPRTTPTQDWNNQEPSVEDFAARTDQQRTSRTSLRPSTPISQPASSPRQESSLGAPAYGSQVRLGPADARDSQPQFSQQRSPRPLNLQPRRTQPRSTQQRNTQPRDRFDNNFENTANRNQQPPRQARQQAPRTEQFLARQETLTRNTSRFEAPRQSVRSRVDRPVAHQRPFESESNFAAERVFHPRITSKPNFELVYDLYGVNNNRQRKIELWYTRDRGRSWELFGSDVDGQSPMEVGLKSQGLYGFRLTVDTGEGPAPPPPPQRDDDADVWVLVDWTKPTGQISGVEMPAGTASREISIEWSAHDTLLADAPITLSYSNHSNGPWTPFARDIPNTGAYYWQVDRRLPERLYFQLEVRDMAGNVTSDVYDGTGGPGVRIRDVQFQ